MSAICLRLQFGARLLFCHARKSESIELVEDLRTGKNLGHDDVADYLFIHSSEN
jgi:hypothetical protein